MIRSVLRRIFKPKSLSFMVALYALGDGRPLYQQEIEVAEYKSSSGGTTEKIYLSSSENYMLVLTKYSGRHDTVRTYFR